MSQCGLQPHCAVFLSEEAGVPADAGTRGTRRAAGTVRTGKGNRAPAADAVNAEKKSEEFTMAIERVREYLKKWDVQDRILEFPTSSATVELAAQAAGCEPARIAKTLSFLVDGQAVLVVAAGDVKVDNAKYKAQFHTKAKMLNAEQVTEMVGHAVGGVCPFAVNDGVRIYLDESLKRFQTVFPAAGSSNSAIEVTIEELETYSGSREWVDVCKMR